MKGEEQEAGIERLKAVNDKAENDQAKNTRDEAENLTQLSKSIEIASHGLNEFGGSLRQRKAEIEEQNRQANFNASPEQIARNDAMMRVKMQIAERDEAYGARKTEITVERMEDRNDAQRLQLQGRNYEAEKLRAQKEGDRAIEEIEAKHAANGYRSTNEYERELNAQKEKNDLAMAEVNRNASGRIAESVGSFMGPGLPLAVKLPPKRPGHDPIREGQNNWQDILRERAENMQARKNANPAASGATGKSQDDKIIGLLGRIADAAEKFSKGVTP